MSAKVGIPRPRDDPLEQVPYLQSVAQSVVAGHIDGLRPEVLRKAVAVAEAEQPILLIGVSAAGPVSLVGQAEGVRLKSDRIDILQTILE